MCGPGYKSRQASPSGGLDTNPSSAALEPGQCHDPLGLSFLICVDQRVALSFDKLTCGKMKDTYSYFLLLCLLMASSLAP